MAAPINHHYSTISDNFHVPTLSANTTMTDVSHSSPLTATIHTAPPHITYNKLQHPVHTTTDNGHYSKLNIHPVADNDMPINIYSSLEESQESIPTLESQYNHIEHPLANEIILTQPQTIPAEYSTLKVH